MSVCNCPKCFTTDSPPRLERYALSFDCQVHADNRADPLATIAELRAEIDLLKGTIDRLRSKQHDER